MKNVIDNNGDLEIVQSKKNAAAGYWNYAKNSTYTAAGAVTSMQLGNGRWETASFNNRLQVTQIGLGNTDSDQNLLKLEYGYATPSRTNNNGSMREQKITVPGAGGSSGFTATQTYGYDDLNRLTVAEETIGGSTTWKQTFEIDRYGNRRFDASNTTTLGSCAQAICNPTISTVTNRISQSGYSFDANGNLTQDAEGRQFVYDAENHQKEVKDSQNNTVGQYLYDGEGRRVKKNSVAETTIFVYNAGGTLVAEYSTELAETQQVSYLTQDHLGSPRVITNENGSVVSRRDFTAFGEESVTAQRTAGLGYEEPEIRKNYTGYEKDAESGLEFAQARYYNPTHGRFTSVDPLTASASIRDPQTFNRYSYVLNSPYKFTDPLGLLSVNTAACGQFCRNSGPQVDGSAFRGRDRSFGTSPWGFESRPNNVTNAPAIEETSGSNGNRTKQETSNNSETDETKPPLPATIGISSIQFSSQTLTNGETSTATVSIETSNDEILSGATIELEFRQISRADVNTSIQASTAESSPADSTGNTTITIAEPGRPIDAKFNVTVNQNNKGNGLTTYRAEIKAVIRKDGKRLDINNVPPTQPPANVVLQPKFLTNWLNIN